MNKKGFAISVVLYSIVFLLISVLYVITGILKTRYHVESDLRDDIVEQINDSVNKRIRCQKVSGTEGALEVGDTFNCDVNGDGLFDSNLEKFYYISNYYNQQTKTFDSSIVVLIHSLNSSGGFTVTTNSPVMWNTESTTNNGPVAVDANFASDNWINIKLKNNPRDIFSGYGSTGSKYTTFEYTKSVRLLTVEEYNFGCNPKSKCNFLWGSDAEVGDGIWLENIASSSNATIYVLKSSSNELSTDSVNANYMARAVIEVSKSSIVY